MRCEKNLYDLVCTAFIKLVKETEFILTDSGGIQEETTVLNVPCLTMRNNAERPITIDVDSNILVGTNKEKILGVVKDIREVRFKKAARPELWDGEVASRIVKILSECK